MSEQEILKIYNRFYSDNTKLLSTVLVHSEQVARKAISVVMPFRESADLNFVREAAMLHDIGVVRCDAPDIYCFGALPYICHGIEGYKILSGYHLPKHALVCERHTGSGLSADDIIRQNLPLPPRDMLPLSLEEKAICYADKFFSKSGNLTLEKPFEKVLAQMERHGKEALDRFLALHALFNINQ